MTPNELDGLARAFRLEEQRPGSPRFQVKVLSGGFGFLVNVQRDGETICYLGGSLHGDLVVPWLVDSANRKTQLAVVEHERMRDLVRRMIMAIPDPHELTGDDEDELLCPGCRTVFHGETTLVGYLNGVDENRAKCGCGWSGRVSELLPTDVGDATVH